MYKYLYYIVSYFNCSYLDVAQRCTAHTAAHICTLSHIQFIHFLQSIFYICNFYIFFSYFYESKLFLCKFCFISPDSRRKHFTARRTVYGFVLYGNLHKLKGENVGYEHFSKITGSLIYLISGSCEYICS